jgi:hypothetical protein
MSGALFFCPPSEKKTFGCAINKEELFPKKPKKISKRK